MYINCLSYDSGLTPVTEPVSTRKMVIFYDEAVDYLMAVVLQVIVAEQTINTKNSNAVAPCVSFSKHCV